MLARRRRGAWNLVKRTLDVVTAVCLVLLALPVLIAVAAAVKRSSPGPVLFRQRRLGQDMRPFTVLKFRTMHDGVSPELHRAYIARLAAGEADGDGLKKLEGDPRVTPIGQLLRRSSLDELPQLFNVLAGQMSLVGPRPALDYELEHYEPRHYERFSVRPGLTGLWQVSGRSALGFKEMLDLDVEYARGQGARFDLGILVRTPGALLSRRAA